MINSFTKRLIAALTWLSLLAVGTLASKPARAAYQFQDDKAEAQTSVTFSVKSAATGSLTIVFDYQDEKNFYALDCEPQQMVLRSVIEGTAHRLAVAPVQWAATNNLTLKRRPWAMQVIMNKQVALTAYDATLRTGKIGSVAAGGWSWQDVRVQPVEELYFTDDFTRAAGKEGEWKNVSGSWLLTSSSENINARNVEMSANPFSYQVAVPGAKAFTQTGRWFWDNYHAEVSVRPGAQGMVGLAVYVQDAQNYLAFLWNAGGGPQARQLVRVVNGQTTVLAHESGAFLPRQWYRIGVRTSPGYLEAFLDGAPIFKVRDASFGQGGIGLVAQNIKLAAFDDARVQSYAYYRQDFDGTNDGSWTPAGGTWKATAGNLTATPQAGGASVARLYLTGGSDWNGYQLIASGRAGAAGACGVVLGYHDNKNYSVFRWAGAQSPLPFHGRQQLLRFSDGKPTIVSDQPLNLKEATDGDGFARVTLRLTPGALTVYAAGRPIAAMADEKLTSGRVGLWTQGAQPVAFRDVVIFFPPEPIPPKVPPKMEDDTLMVGWASNSGEWPASIHEDRPEYWNTGDFFGDMSLEMMWRRATYAHSTLEIALRAQHNEFASGYVMRCEATDDTGLHLALKQGDKVLKESHFDWKELSAADLAKAAAAGSPETIPIKVDLAGGAVIFSVAGRPALSYLNAAAGTAPTGTMLGVRSFRLNLRSKELRAFTSHRDDYTFTEAPTDWYTPQGNWSVISRWPCFSDWSFFGGKGVNPVLWSKRSYSGDTVVEMYAHNQMDLPKEIAYSSPGNLNITLDGDGKNPSSGYSFILAGWNNTQTRILKGTDAVAENKSDDARFPKPINHNMQFHRRWYHVRAEARRTQQNGQSGVKLTLTVDDKVLAEYFDATPLESYQRGGHVAFWTVDGTIMIARAKIESENMGTRALPIGLLDAVAPTGTLPPKSSSGQLTLRPVLADGVPSSLIEQTTSQGSNPVWTLRNPTAGGIFEAQVAQPGGDATATWQVTPTTKLDFDMALPKEVKVDLYVSINGVLHLVALSNTQPPDARAPLLGTVTRTPGAAGWEHVTFDLGAALKQLHPNAQSWKAEQIAFGALHGDEYRWLGFGGNPLGASYRLRGLKISGATQIAAAPATR